MKKNKEYSIGEVSDIVDVKESTLRYWEKEFKEINPRKAKSRRRKYSADDINIIFRIKELLYNRKFTIDGAKQYLKEQRNPFDENFFNQNNNNTSNKQDDTNDNSISEKEKKFLEIKEKTISELKEILKILS